MTQEMMYDPPTGWRYGFPKVYRPAQGETIEDTLERDGYPRAMADDFGGKHCRFWSASPAAPVKNLDSVACRYVEHDTLPQETFAPLVERDERGIQRIVRPVAVGAAQAANDNNCNDFITTYTGRFWPMQPRAGDVRIEDIAHSLSMQCRYAGHCRRFYSVAEHSIFIANWLWHQGYLANTALAGLLHDAPEAYLVDVPRPVKKKLVGYKEAEQAVWLVIADSFGLPQTMPAAVHEADSRILVDEMSSNMREVDPNIERNPLGVELQFWSPEEAEANFLATFSVLQKLSTPTNATGCDDHYPEHDRAASAADRAYQLAKEAAA